MKVTYTIEIFSLAYLFIISCVYFSKRKVKSYENTFYVLLLINNFIQIFLEFFSVYLISVKGTYPFLCNFVSKFYLIGIMYYVLLMAGYIEYSLKDMPNMERLPIRDRIVLIFNCTFCLVIVGILNIEFYSRPSSLGTLVLAKGNAIHMTYLFAFITLVYTFIRIVTIKSKNKRNAGITWLLLFFAIAIDLILRASYAGILVTSSVMTFINIIMYFVVQSPDVKKVVELKKIKKSEEIVNKNKTNFLLSMSHEIRTCLNAIDILGNEVLSSIDEEYDDEREEAHDILVASDTLLDLVDNILDINKIQNGELVINNEDYNLKKEIDTIVKMSIVRIENKPINFVMNVDKDIPDILYGDKVKVKQIINNLLTNAFKYTEKGSVTLNVRCNVSDYKAYITIEVKDTGIGIKDTSRLFTKFDRMDLDKTSQIEGTGLGLVITKQLVDLLKGTLNVESVYGEGSKFTFTFTQEVGSEVFDVQKENVYNTNLVGKKVLIVDDNILNLKADRQLFSKYNFRIDTCKSGKEAINMIRSNKYDFILLDIMMPDMDGIETLHSIKMYNSSLIVIALTAYAVNGAREKYLKDGFDGYIEKPVDRKLVDKEFDRLFKE